LERAIEQGSIEYVDRLIESGADVNRVDQDGSSPMDLAIRQLNAEMVRFLLKAGGRPHSEDPLYTGCLMGNVDIVKTFLRAGYDPNDASKRGGETPLMLSAYAQSYKLVRILLEGGVAINGVNRDGKTALFSAVATCSIHITGMMLPNGAKILSPQTVRLPERGRAKRIIQLLLDKGADANHRDKDGRTAITYSSSGSVARLLIQRGAKLDIQDRRGHDPTYWLKKNGIILESSLINNSFAAENRLGNRSLRGAKRRGTGG
jgi:ankyrin repeat protein